MIRSFWPLMLLGAPAPLTPAQPPAPDPAEVVRQALTPPPAPRLLREGSFLTRVNGTVHLDEETGWWLFQIDDDAPEPAHAAAPAPESAPAPADAFIMLPNRKLQEMRQVVDAAQGERVIFEMSGEVFLYGGRNFLLASHAPRLVGYQTPSSPGDEPGSVASPQGGAEESIEDIMRRLSEAVGPLRRSSALADDASFAEDDRIAERDAQPIVARRGHLVRDETGARVFVFDADAEGGADPPLIVMPCLMLERLAAHAQPLGRPAPLLLSGRVYHFDGRGYVLPTVFRVPRERTPLRP